MFLVIYFVLLMNLGSICESYDSIVQTNYGRVGGVAKISRNGRSFLSFAGIPFAKPPVGDLRFANPEKPNSWQHVLNGSTSSPRCIQRNYLFYIVPPIEGSEDCLYLNVYVPQSDTVLSERKLSVIVSIPWGGFLAEGGDEGYFDPSYFLDYDVILVSLNYRVGVFGFLSTLDDEAPGNVGLKDQVVALQWVQENIEYFGGMKENVTIMGQSAGAGSTSLHMISPASRGLFSKAISESGNALASWAVPDNDLQRTVVLLQAQLVNCSDATESSKALIKCLRAVSAEGLLLSQDAFKIFYQYAFTAYGLVTETATERNPNPFLTKTALEYVQAGEFQKVPWLTGTVKNEGLLVVSGFLGPEEERNAFNTSFSTYVSGFLDLSPYTNDTESLYQNISELYLGGKNYISDDEEWQQGFIDLWSDKFFIYSGYKAVSLQVANGHDSIYFYSFEYAGENTFGGLWSNGSGMYNPNWSVSHCDELLYLFKSPDLFDQQLTSANDQELSNILVNLWTNFAIYGNPNPPENVILNNVNWEPLKLNSDGSFTNEDVTFLNVTGSYKTGALFEITRGFNKKRMSFWDDNLPIEKS